MELYIYPVFYNYKPAAVVPAPPAVKSVTATGEYQVTVEFTEELSALGTLEVKKGNDAVELVDAYTFVAGNKKATFSVDAGTYVGAATSVELSVTVAGYKDVDNYVGAKTTNSVTLTLDKTAPTITKAEIDKDNKKTIHFTLSEESELVGGFSIADLFVTIYNDKGEYIANAPTAAVFAQDVTSKAWIMTVTLTSALANGTYELAVVKEAFQDKATTPNKNAAQAVSVTVAAAVAPPTTQVAPVVTGVVVNGNEIEVTFDEKVKGGTSAGSATNLDNYVLGRGALPAGTTIVLDSVGQKVATITLPAGSVAVTGVNVLYIEGVEGLEAGHKAPVAKVDFLLTLNDNTKPVLQSAAYDATEKTIVLTFSEKVKADTAANFIADLGVKVNGAAAVIDNATLTAAAFGAGTNKVSFKLVDVNLAAGEVVISVVNAPASIQDLSTLNNKLTGKTEVTMSR